MFENFEFEFIDGGIAITSYLGNNPIISIPREIYGNKVIKIGDEAFRDMEFIEEVEFEEGLLEIGNYAFCKCSSIKRLILPNSVAEIGSHAFYNCRNVEEMTLPRSLVFAGDGFIKNCGKIKTVNIASSFEISAAVVSVLNELKEEFVLHAEKEDIRLLFPAYDFDFVVNAPARLCTTYTVGSGDRYRQAITQKGIDFESYDNTFSRAVTEERENTVFHIIFERLLSNYNIDGKFIDKYLQYLKENVERAMNYALKNGGVSLLEIMDKNNVFTNENIDSAIKAAAELGNSESAAFMLDLKLTKFGRKLKKFDL